MAMAKGTKSRIERTALELFVEKGIRETTVRDIAAAAGIAEGTLYRHYESKDALAAALFRENYERLSADLAALARTGQNLPELLADMIGYACQAFDDDWVLFSYLLLSQHRHLRQRPASAPGPVNVLRDAVKAAMARGEIPRGDSELAAAMVLGVVLQAAVSVVYGRLPGPLSAYRDRLSAAAQRLLQVPEEPCAGSSRRQKG